MVRALLHRVAVTGVSGDIGLGTLHGLRAGPRDVHIIGLDHSADCAGFHLADEGVRVPPVADDHYFDTLCRLLKERSVELLFIGVDSEVPLLAPRREELRNRSGAVPVLLDEKLVRTFTDKLLTSRFLEQNGLPAPATLAGEMSFEDCTKTLGRPYMAKPRSGHGSFGLAKVDDEHGHLRVQQDHAASMCFQQLIDGPEYTCGLLFEKEGQLADHIVMKRELAEGRTVMAEVAKELSIERFIIDFAAKLPEARGPLNLQLRLTSDDVPLVFEVNPRLSGSTAMRVAVGFNDPWRLVAHLLDGEPIEPAEIKPARVFRTRHDLVVPL